MSAELKICIEEAYIMDDMERETTDRTSGPMAAAQEISWEEELNPFIRRICEQYGYFLLMGLIFGLLFAACFYRVNGGIMRPVFVIILYGMTVCSMRRLDVKVKRGSAVYMAGSLLLGLCSLFTASWFFDFFNLIGILILYSVFVLHQRCDIREWGLAEHFSRICMLGIYACGGICYPFSDAGRWARERRKHTGRRLTEYLIGTLIGIPILLVIVWLLGQADMVFGRLVDRINIFRRWDMDAVGVLFFTVIGFFAYFGYLQGSLKHDMNAQVKEVKKRSQSLIIVPCVALTAVYAVFCVIQVLYLFTGGLSLPEGYTYAEYARSGYMQLLLVTAFNFVWVLYCLKHFEESAHLKTVLTLCCGCTFIMIASAAYRMILYIHAYRLTFLRVLVLWSLIVLTVLLAGGVVLIYRRRFPVFRFGLLVVLTAYLLLGFTKPDFWIARYNVSHAEVIEWDDMHFLTNLSLDAAPVAALLEKERMTLDAAQEQERYKRFITDNEERFGGWRNFNISNYLALKACGQ